MTIPSERDALRGLLPGGAFIKPARRGDGYVTDAPVRTTDPQGLMKALEKAGYTACLDGGLIRIVPGARRLLALETAWPDPPDVLCRQLARFAGHKANKEVQDLYAAGMICLEGRGRGFAIYDRRLRQAAALCLRQGGGGGLYACALARRAILDEICGKGAFDTP